MGKLLLILFTCLTCSAQLPVIPVALVSSGPITFDLTGVAYHWNMNDIVTNAALSGGWTDEVQHLVWTNGATAQVPTNGSPNGVWTDSTHWFTNNGMTGMGSNLAFGFTVKILDCGFFSSLTRPSFWNNGDSSGTKTFRIGFDSNNSYWMESVGDGSTEWGTGPSPWRATNAFVDIVWNQVVTNNNTYAIYVYTNGVLMYSQNQVDGKYLGSLNASFFTPSYVLMMGHDNLRVNGPKMYWQDIVGWTNSPPGAAQGDPLSATRIANYHKWSTNNWPHTP